MYLCTGYGAGIIRVWGFRREKCVWTCNGHAGPIMELAVYEVQNGTTSATTTQYVVFWLARLFGQGFGLDGDGGFICKRTLGDDDHEFFLALAGDKLVTGSAEGALVSGVWCL